MDECSRLLVMQQQLEKDAQGKVKFFGLSVSETIRTCLINGMGNKADRAKSDFKVPDKRCVDPLSSHSIVVTLSPVDSGTSNFTH